ncbi:hypothetical protein [Paracoccus sp. N5]|uniref:DUF7064 domain-containing protein n=1 Tax=Paracoccus sp. N5 TaxID=1101189 RepID=UPI00037A4527|nr:hypothetical protein [Paracoccus sp. N5]
MITEKDSSYHPSNPAEWRWTETTPLIFSVPEAGILGNLYVASRPNLGVALSSIAIGQGICRQSYEIDFSDAQMHLPAPDNFTNYTLENGLSVQVTAPPRDYHFRYAYKGGDECSLDLRFRGLHRPFDCDDPEENTLLKVPGGQVYDSRLGDQWGNKSTDAEFPSGHFNTIGHITGELVLRGKRYDVDCYDCMDHSWSRRTEVSRRAVAFISACFDDSYGLHMAVPIQLVDGETVYDGLRFGFVVEDGQTYGLVDARVGGATQELLPINCWIEATDVRGKVHRMTGSAIAGHPYDNFNPSHIAYQCLMRWETSDGRVGHSELANIFGREYLAAHLSRLGRRAA